MEMLGKILREKLIEKRYMKDVREGEKSIIIIDGEKVGEMKRVK